MSGKRPLSRQSPNPEPAHVGSAPRQMEIDGFGTFLAGLRRYPLLRASEEVTLARAIEQGDEGAKERLVNANLRLVVSVARRYQGRGIALPDLVQEGSIGLVRAAEKYDWRLGFRFSTYATWWITQAITRCLANQSRSIRLPAHLVDQANKITRAEAELTALNGTAPQDADLAEATNVPVDRVQLIRNAARVVTSLDVPISVHPESPPLSTIIPDDTDVSDVVHNGLKHQAFQLAIEKLPERERAVLERRYGLGSHPTMTLLAIGQGLGLSKERVRQIENTALERLQTTKGLAEWQNE